MKNGQHFLLTLLVVFFSATTASAMSSKPSKISDLNRLTTYPTVSGAQKSENYSITVNGKPVFVESCKEDVSLANFAIFGKADITITSKDPITKSNISPRRYNIKSEVDDKTLSFSISKPTNLVITINGYEKLFFFADPEQKNELKDFVNILDFDVDNTGKVLETDKIQKAIDGLAKGGVLHFPAGTYKVTNLSLKSDMTLHLAAGAMLKATSELTDYKGRHAGMISIENSNNVNITGVGIIDGNGNHLRKNGIGGHFIIMKNCKNVVVEDVMLRDPAGWNTHIICSSDITVRNIKMINDLTTPNTDGINPDSSSNVLIENNFAYCGDDNVAVKSTGWGGVLKDVNNIMVRGNVFLTRKSALKVGTETNAKHMKNISFINNEVLMSDRCMAIYCRDGATISNVQFIGNHFEECHKDAKQRMIDMYIRKRKALGQIKNVLIKDCSFDAPWPKPSTIFGQSPEHSIDGLTIENFIIAGKPCRNAREANMKIGPNVNNATFNGDPVKY